MAALYHLVDTAETRREKRVIRHETVVDPSKIDEWNQTLASWGVEAAFEPCDCARRGEA